MTEQELSARVAELNAQMAALKEERDRLAWTEGVPAIIAKMKSMGKATLCLRDGEDFFEYTVSLWGYFEYGRGAAKKLYLDENDNLILIYNDLMNHENPSDSYWEYGDEDNEVIVNEEISNEIIAPNIDTLLNTKFYERYGLPFTLTENMQPTENMQSMFEGCPDTIMDLSSVDTSNVTDMSCMLNGCEYLQVINFGDMNTSNVTSMSGIFYNCYDLENIDVSNFDTSKVTDMGGMFYGCSSLQELDLSNFNTSKVTDMSGMFYGCRSLQSLDLRPLNTSEVTNMNGMFFDCSSLQSLDLSNFNTSKVTDMNRMFNRCSSLQSLDLSNFVISEKTKISDMFKGCDSLKTVIMRNCSNKTVKKIKAVLPEGVEIIR